MLIDFHTHCFPDPVAAKAIPKLAGIGGLTPFTDGTKDGLLRELDRCGVSHAVCLNIATNTHQQPKVNDFALTLERTEPRLTAFGSVHPDSAEKYETVRALHEAGLRGLKLHPDYQEAELTDPRYDEIFTACRDFGMLVLIHAGWDFYSPGHIHAPPAATAEILRRYPGLQLIAAHLGGNRQLPEVIRHLVGKEVYLDTSLCCVGVSRGEVKDILVNHDPDRLLFGSDLPWCHPELTREFLLSLSLPDALYEKIFYKNAQRLLDL